LTSRDNLVLRSDLNIFAKKSIVPEIEEDTDVLESNGGDVAEEVDEVEDCEDSVPAVGETEVEPKVD